MSIDKARAARKSPGGALPGNLNAVTTVWRSFWKKRALPDSHKWALKISENYHKAMAKDYPTPDARQARLIEIAATSRTLAGLLVDEARQQGLVRTNKDGALESQPVVDTMSKFLGQEMRALNSLGPPEAKDKDDNPLDNFNQRIIEAKVVSND